MDFFNECWLIVRLHEFIYIAEIKIGNFYSRVISALKQFLHMCDTYHCHNLRHTTFQFYEIDFQLNKDFTS